MLYAFPIQRSSGSGVVTLRPPREFFCSLAPENSDVYKCVNSFADEILLTNPAGIQLLDCANDIHDKYH